MNKDEFENILKRTKEECEAVISQENREFSSGTDFEGFVYNQMEEKIEETYRIKGDLKHEGVSIFPDITCGEFGVEVKKSQSGWKSTGNSVNEGNRVSGIEKIYLFFLNEPEGEISVRSYEDCLYSVAVTHYPRYKIDMEQPPEESVFKQMGIDYEEFREQDYPIQKIRNYMRNQLKKGDKVWWLDSHERTISATVKPWGKVDTDRKDDLKAELMVLFPEVFSSEYVGPAIYLLEEYQVLAHNARDLFSSGGEEKVVLENGKKEVSRIYKNLQEWAPKIRNILRDAGKEKLQSKWETSKPIEDPEITWENQLQEKAGEPKAAEIYEVGLTLPS